ncbi:MAG: diacylglycerol kinase family lipid kinase [Lachnospiraceae bacterium]|nr:diacylglycerol kinase family lipid kinase [Lachnospiraceae bacterium]
MKKRLLFVFNPLSGKGLIRNKLLEIVDQFVKNGYEVVIYPTQKPQDAMELVEEHAGEYHLVVCSGGDGTLDEVVGGMMRREWKVPIGYIPSGSTNDFASSLKIPKDMGRAAQLAVSGVPYACDVGNFNGKHFVYIAAFGLFTDVSYATSQERKNRIGHFAYIIEGVKRIPAVQPYFLKISSGDREIEGHFIYGMVTNSVSAGGFRNITGKNVKLNDGLFEVTLIQMPRNPMELNEIIASLTNLIDNTDLIYTFKTDCLKVEACEDVAWTLDGEYGGKHKDVTISAKKQAVEIIVSHEMAHS